MKRVYFWSEHPTDDKAPRTKVYLSSYCGGTRLFIMDANKNAKNKTIADIGFVHVTFFITCVDIFGVDTKDPNSYIPRSFRLFLENNKKKTKRA